MKKVFNMLMASKENLVSKNFYGGASMSDGHNSLVSAIRTIIPIGTGIIVNSIIIIRMIKGAILKIVSKVKSIFDSFCYHAMSMN